MGFNRQSIETATISDKFKGRVPRRTRPEGTGIAMSIAALFILVWASSWAVSTVVDVRQQVRRRSALRGNGSVVTGWKEHLLPRRGRDEKLRYSFTVSGERYTGEAGVPRDNLIAVIHSPALGIRYLPANPSVNHPADWEWSPEWGQMFPLSLTFLMGGVLFAAVLMEMQLVANGTAASAVVTECTENGKGGFKVSYEFRTEDGTEVQGRGWSASDQDVGDRICVLYLPRNPKRNQPYPGQLVRVVE
jgi:hypothetical protein